MKRFSYTVKLTVDADSSQSAATQIQQQLSQHKVDASQLNDEGDLLDSHLCKEGPLPPNGFRFLSVVSKAQITYDSGQLGDCEFYLAIPGDQPIPPLNLTHTAFQGERSRDWDDLNKLPEGTLARHTMWNEWVPIADFLKTR